VATRIDDEMVDPDKNEILRRWLEEKPRHRGALLLAEAALSFLDRGRALAGVVPKPERRPIWIRRKLLFAGAALAAGIAGVAILMTAPQHYDTRVGEIRQVPLSDGSLVAINTQSAVEVAMHPHVREVTLTARRSMVQGCPRQESSLHCQRWPNPGLCSRGPAFSVTAR